LRYGDDIEPCGFDNKGMVKMDLMVDIYGDDKLRLNLIRTRYQLKR
jgi:hypothetical protein